MAGNVGLLKYASKSRSALAIEEVPAMLVFQKELFKPSSSSTESAYPYFIADPRIAAVTLTGSVGAGKQCGRNRG